MHAREWLKRVLVEEGLPAAEVNRLLASAAEAARRMESYSVHGDAVIYSVRASGEPPTGYYRTLDGSVRLRVAEGYIVTIGPRALKCTCPDANRATSRGARLTGLDPQLAARLTLCKHVVAALLHALEAGLVGPDDVEPVLRAAAALRAAALHALPAPRAAKRIRELLGGPEPGVESAARGVGAGRGGAARRDASGGRHTVDVAEA